MSQLLSGRFHLRSAIGCATVFGLCLLAGSVGAEQPISPAETLLFLTNHMQSIRTPVELTYSYKKEGTAELDFDDEVHLDITDVHPDKSVTLAMRFLSGGRAVALPALDAASGNPVVLGFLERDTIEMKRLTGGSPNYFRKRIRLALADVKKLRPVRFTYGGRQRDGQEIQIQPYLDDPLRDRFKGLVDKSYVFVISDAVPGSLYQIRTSSGGGGFMDSPAPERKKSVVTETLTLVKEQPLARAAKGR